MLEMGIAIEDVRSRFGSDGVFELPHFVLDPAKVIRSAKSFFEHGSAFMEIGDLIECADLKVGLARDGTRVGFIDAADQLEKSGLPRAIGADEADSFGWIDLESGVPKHVLRTERLRDAIELYDHDP